MPGFLDFAGESAVFFGRRPEELIENIVPRQLASNASAPYKFAYARTALKYGLKYCDFKQGDVLLVPDLICDSLVEPLVQLGIKPQYYPVDPTLQPEWGRLEQFLTKSTKAFLVVHYFGQPQPIPECIEFCRLHSLMLIEDNAHGFGGLFKDKLLGTFGEIGVSAPRKSFPISNGAYLYIAKDNALDTSTLQLQPSNSSSLKHHCKQWLKRIPLVRVVTKIRGRIIEYRRRLGPRPPYGSQDAFRDHPLRHDYGMDDSIDKYLGRQNIEQIRNIRRQIYHLWQQWALSQGLRPVFPNLSPGAIPLVFPAYAESAAASLQWYERGHRAGVDIHSWPTLPQVIVERNGEAMQIWKHLVCFPIHQEMDVRILEKRLTVL